MTLPTPLLNLQAALDGRAPHGPRRPWLSWTLIALCRQRLRQDWLVQVAEKHLSGEEEDCGDVPGLAGWSFNFHGRGLCLAGPNNEILDVDFYAGDDGPQTIDPYFFIHRVLGLRDKPNVEARVASWLGGSSDLMAEALRQLRRDGLLQHPDSEHVFRLHPWLEGRYQEIGSLDFEDEQTWLHWSAALGEGPGHSDVQDRAFSDWAREILADRSRARAIEGLAAVLPEEVVVEACQHLMAGPVDSVSGKAVRVLRQRNYAPGTHADALLQRLDPTEHNPFTAVQLAEWLFENGRSETALQLLQRFSDQRVFTGFRGNPFDGDYAVLALRFVPSEAMHFVRRALRSRTPNSLEKTAALLSVLDETWCREELLLAAQECTDAASLRFLVGCLMHSADALTQEAAKALVPAPPDFDEQRIGYTYEEVHFLNLRENVGYRRSAAREAAAVLRPH